MSVRPSMGTVGDAYDNGMAESFFVSLEGRAHRAQQLPKQGAGPHGSLHLE